MKIAVTASQPDLDSQVDPRFGRCLYFLVVDPETLQCQTIDNSNSMGGGAGVSTAQSVIKEGVRAVLTGNCGPNAHQVLSAAGIEVITGVSGKIKQAVQDYQSGKLQASAQPNVPDHFGSRQGGGHGFRRGQA
jgi:predicted Fe-Mo cluster-binding NifX family protein